LFFPIFAGLRAHDVDVSVLQLTWAADAQLEAVANAAHAHGVCYARRRVPPLLRKALLPSVLAYGAWSAARLMRDQGIRTLFPRSLLPMGMALMARRFLPSLDLMFDADGFMADERVDFGGWRPSGLPYRALRQIEARGTRQARAVICRTDSARELLVARGGGTVALREKIFVAPNGKDTTLFAPRGTGPNRAVRARYRVGEGAPWLVHVGSIGAQYCPELMLQTFARILAQRPDAHLSCFTFQGAALQALAERQGLPRGSFSVGPLAPNDVPEVLSAADLGFAFRLESSSQRGVSPIKVGEYLLCGLPVVTSRVGDLEMQLRGSPAARLVSLTTPEAAQSVADWFVASVLPERSELGRQARALGLRWFDLQRCVETYARAARHGLGTRS